MRDRILDMRSILIEQIIGFQAGNPKQRRKEDADLLDASLEENGYAAPILVRIASPDLYELIDGHQRIDRIRERFPDVKEIKAIILDVESVAEGRKLILGLQHTAGFELADMDKWVREGLAAGDMTADEVMRLSGLTAADLDSLAEAGQQFLDDLDKETNDGGGPATEQKKDEAGGTERASKVFVFAKEKLADACFAHYRAAGFPYPDPSPTECMLSINRLASMTLEALMRTHEGGPAADKFQRHRYEAIADGMVSPHTAFMDDKKLRYVIDMIIDSTGTIGDGTLRSMLGMVQGAQSCSNFRPGYAAYLYRRFVPPGGTVLDTSAGFGGRLVGAIASTVVGHYIGIDPNKPSIEGSKKLLALLGREDFAEFVVQPAEDIKVQRWAGRCDFMFTSPPYFNKERYSDDPNQSGNRYPQADVWREKFLVPMMKLTYASLVDGGHAAINIADVLVEKIRHPLGDWTVAAGKRVGFEHVGSLEFPIGGSRRFGTMKNGGAAPVDDDSTEPVFLFRKPEASPSAKKKK